MNSLAFPLRFGARMVAVTAVPFLTGARDRLSFYEKQGATSPLESLGEFISGAIKDQGIAERSEEIQRFLELCIGSSSRLYGGRTWVQVSFTSKEQGIGLSIFNDKRRIVDCFDRYLNATGISGPAADFARAICEPFSDSAYAQLRAEFRQGKPVRISLYGGWVLDSFRGHGGFDKVFNKLAPEVRNSRLIEHARHIAELQSPELYPYGIGVSFSPGVEAPQLKVYTTRFDEKSSPLRGEGCLESLLDTLGLSAEKFKVVHNFHDAMWQAAKTKAIQVATTVEPDSSAPSRVSLLYCGVSDEDARLALLDAGFPEESLAPFECLHEHFGSRCPLYVGVGVGPDGFSPRIKLYDAAFFQDTDVSALERLRPKRKKKSIEPPLALPALRDPPGPTFASAPGLALRMMNDSFSTLHRLRAQYGDVINLGGIGLSNTYFMFGPDGIKRMFQSNSKNYIRGENFRNVANVVGNGIVISEGPFWRRQRKQVSAALMRSVVNTQVGQMVAIIEKMLGTWERFADTGEWFDVADQMREVTRRITLNVMLGIDEDTEAGNISSTWEEVYDALTYFTTRPWVPPLSMPLPRYRRFKKAMGAFDRRIYKKIAEHRANPEAAGDLVRFLLDARDPVSGRPMTERQLRDELVTVTSAGFDTAAVSLAWTCLLLSQHPWAAHRIAKEASEVLGDRLPTADDVPNLEFTRLVVSESMRMYPAAWILTRTCVEEDELCGFRIPSGAMVITSAWVIHHHPGHWERPEQFNPERFTKEGYASRSRFAYFPFGDGPRKCPGEHFAMAEIISAIAVLCQRFVLRSKPDHPIVLEPSFTLRPRHGLMMRIERRDPKGLLDSEVPQSSGPST